jgi:hypothetical protein
MAGSSPAMTEKEHPREAKKVQSLRYFPVCATDAKVVEL